MLRLLATNTAGELVPTRLANDLGIGGDTIRRYLGVLEMVGLRRGDRIWALPITTLWA